MRRQLHIDDLWAGLLYKLALLALAAFFALVGALLGVAGVAAGTGVPLAGAALIGVAALLAVVAAAQGQPQAVQAMTDFDEPDTTLVRKVEDRTDLIVVQPRLPRAAPEWSASLEPAEPRAHGSVDIRALGDDDLVVSDELARMLQHYLEDEDRMPLN